MLQSSSPTGGQISVLTALRQLGTKTPCLIVRLPPRVLQPSLPHKRTNTIAKYYRLHKAELDPFANPDARTWPTPKADRAGADWSPAEVVAFIAVLREQGSPRLDDYAALKVTDLAKPTWIIGC